MLADYMKDGERNVLVYCRGKFHLPLLEPLARTNPDITFYLQTPLLSKVEFLGSSFGQLPNVHYVWSFDELKYKLDDFGAFITTDAQSANGHWYSLRTVRLMNRLGVPVFEMQHGLFQLGLHYYDEPGKATFGGDSLPSESYADHILAYYGVPGVRKPMSVIGYPPFNGIYGESVRGDYLLVLSNLHWPTYTPEERRGFYRAVYSAIERRAELPVIWKQHHGEYNNADCKSWIAECAKDFPDAAKRIRFFHLDASLNEKTLAELISCAGDIISSISTVLLDCEMGGKSVAVYTAPSVKCLTDRLSVKSTFAAAEDLDRLLTEGPVPLKSGLLHPFQPAVFRKALDGAYRKTSLSRAEFLDAVFELGQPLNSELRGSISSVMKETVALKQTLEADQVKLKDVGVALDGQGAQLGKMLENVQALATVPAVLDGQGVQLGQMLKNVQALARVPAAMDGQGVQLGQMFKSLQVLAEVPAVLDGQGAQLEQMLECLQPLVSMKSALDNQGTQLEQMLKHLQTLTTVQAQCMADLRQSLQKRETELLEIRKNLTARTAEAKACAVQLASARKTIESVQRALEVETQRNKALTHQLEAKGFSNRLRRLAFALLPYGVVCTWRRMVHGNDEDVPLFYYPGLFKRIRRLLKFTLPYGLVRVYRNRGTRKK